MRVGLVCPYSLDVPGGVQQHVLDLAEELDSRGHGVSVLAPATRTDRLPPYVVPAGRSIAIPYNGSVARIALGPAAAARVRSWMRGGVDVLHVHEPLVPAVSLGALTADVPIVATFHSSQQRSRLLRLAGRAFGGRLARIDARIAVSREARRTVREHLGVDARVIPNGIDTSRFREAAPDPRFAGARHGGPPTICFLGRLDEPRKGLAVLARAIPQILRETDARVLVAGAGSGEVAEGLDDRVTFLGPLAEADKYALFASADVYVAPQTGGESFGIVLLEAMAGGARVVASDLPAFRDVLDEGRVGHLFRTGDAEDLSRAVLRALREPSPPGAAEWTASFDWTRVADDILAVYAEVLQRRP